MAQHRSIDAAVRGRIYVSSRTSPPKNGVLANEEGSIYGRSHRDLTSAPVGGPVEQRVRRPRRALLHASRLFRDSRRLVQADPCCSRRAQAPAKTILPRSNGT